MTYLVSIARADYLFSTILQIFERLLEIPIEWSKGRATGEVLF